MTSDPINGVLLTMHVDSGGECGDKIERTAMDVREASLHIESLPARLVFEVDKEEKSLSSNNGPICTALLCKQQQQHSQQQQHLD